MPAAKHLISRRFTARIILLALLTTLCFGRSSHAIDPDSPIVKQAIYNAVQFLEKSSDKRLGAQALVGMVFAKNGANDDHPKIKSAIESIRKVTKNGPEKVRSDIYSTGIAIMFLVSVDPSRYRAEIETLVKSLHIRQKKHGAWGYPVGSRHSDTCDTSMTQYAVLGLWEAEEQSGVDTPDYVWDRVARWLLLTQDENGGFGYQGNPSDGLGDYVKQSGVRHSMVAAGMGSLYIAKDRLGIRKLKKGALDDTPSVFEPFETTVERKARIKTKIELRFFSRAISRGNRWIEDKYEIDDLKNWQYYSIYAYERYQTLREAEEASGPAYLDSKAKKNWYHLGARYLLDEQEVDGSWDGQAGVVPSTCFATLFLLGSTRKSLEKTGVVRYKAGILIGGEGLPKSKQVRLRDGKVVVKPLEAGLPRVIEVLRDEQHKDYAKAIEALADAGRTGDPTQVQRNRTGIQRLAVRGKGEVRILAIQAIEYAKDLEQVPALIYLLNDSDERVLLAANKALAALSRRFDAESLGAQPSNDVRQKAIASWKAWYRSVRPDVDLDTFQPATD